MLLVSVLLTARERATKRDVYRALRGEQADAAEVPTVMQASACAHCVGAPGAVGPTLCLDK